MRSLFTTLRTPLQIEIFYEFFQKKPAEIFGPDRGYLIHPGDVGDIAAKLGLLFERLDSFSAEAISAQAAGKYGHQAVAAAFDRVYKRVLEKNARG
jgi:hypothetical protein